MSTVSSLPAGDRSALGPTSCPETWSARAPFLCVFDDVFLLGVDRILGSRRPLGLRLDDLAIRGPLISAKLGRRHLLAGGTPVGLSDKETIATVSLSSSNHRETLRFDDSIPVRRGLSAIAEVLNAVPASDPAVTVTAVLSMVTSIGTDLGDDLQALTRNIVEKACCAVGDAWCHPLDAKLRYCRFRLRQPITEPLPRALPTQCFFLAERTLVQVAGGKMLVIGGTAHLLVPGVLAGAKGTLIVMVGNRVFSLAVEKCAAEAPALALETIASVEPVHAEAIKRFLLSRCTELYRSSKSRALLDLGNLIWALTEFPHRAFVRPNVNFGLAIENILPVPGKGILITGWLWDPAERLEQLLLVDAHGYRKPIQAPMHRYDRPDICLRFKARPTDEPLGFLTFQPCAAAHDLWPTYQVKGMLKDGRVIDLSCCLKASRRALSEPENLLRQLPADKLDGPLLRDLAPTIGYLQARNEQLALYRQFWNYDRVAKEDVRGASLPRPRVDGPMLTARPRGVAVGAVGRGPSLADAAGRQANTTPAQGRPPMKRACRGQ